jgi:iron(III) transport system substrate-binding protein
MGADPSRPIRPVPAALVMLLIGALLACAAPAPSPVTAPSKPAPAAANASAPASASAPSGQAAAAPTGLSEWDQPVAAARREGKLELAGPNTTFGRQALLEFQKDYPDITVSYSGTPITEFLSKIAAERAADQFLWDIIVTGTGPQRELKPRGALDPLRPALILPEVLDDSKWLGGYEAGWSDSEKQFVYIFQGSLGHPGYVNRDVIREPELARMDDTVDPKYRGKISWQDPRRAGPGSGNATHLLMTLGEDFIRKMWAQDVVTTTDGRQQVEWLVRGQYPIAFGIATATLSEFQEQGLGQHVGPIAPGTQAGDRMSTGFGALYLVNRAPHPNAAKLFANWLLSHRGQTAWAGIALEASRRLDVTDAPADRQPDPNVKLLTLDDDAAFAVETRQNEIAREVLR